MYFLVLETVLSLPHYDHMNTLSSSRYVQSCGPFFVVAWITFNVANLTYWNTLEPVLNKNKQLSNLGACETQIIAIAVTLSYENCARDLYCWFSEKKLVQDCWEDNYKGGDDPLEKQFPFMTRRVAITLNNWDWWNTAKR